MQFNFLTTLFAFGALILHASALPQVSSSDLAARALGINCRGSGMCSFQPDGVMQKLYSTVQSLDKNRLYNNGYHIACVRNDGADGICAFLQNADHQVSGGVVIELIKGLVNHNCKTCGSNPVYNYGGSPSNDPRWGILTVNYVSKADNPCNGICR